MTTPKPPGIEEFEPGAILGVLERHEVRYVVIGALAAIASGAPLLTVDLDITPARDRENLDRLAAALRDLEARLRTPHDEDGVPFPVDAAMLATAENWTLLTSGGALDLIFVPAGTAGYDDLCRDAHKVRIGGLDVPGASLADVIRCKEAAGRPKDLRAIPILRETLEVIREREDRSV